MRVVSLLVLTAAITAAQTTTGWQLVWSDEFNGTAGAPPNPANWDYDLGGGGWGNGEAETYTNSPNNVFQDGNGNLDIRVIKDAQGNYTSARLQTGSPGASTSTANLSWQYGLIEARIKLPPGGQGIWPAFWMLGEDYTAVNWPACGEVDIMENFGAFNNNATVNNGSLHGPVSPSASTDYSVSTTTTLPFGETVYDDYHVYAVEWSPNSVQFFLDGLPYQTGTPASLATGNVWEFNAPFFILLNFAIGGPNTFLGTPNASVPFPQDLLVDYVRVYQATSVAATAPVITPGRVVNAASYLGAISPGSLATVFGNNLADAVHLVPAPAAGQSYPTNVANVVVTVNGAPAPLTYVSPTQINFQVPWETPAPGLAVPVQVATNVSKTGSVPSNVENVTVASSVAPSFFLSELVNGVAWVIGTAAQGCASSECTVTAGSTYELLANGLGPKAQPQQDGVPAQGSSQVAGGPSACQLTIGGQSATVSYCGTASGQLIDQVNFTYPTGVSTASPYVSATLTINGVTGHFRVPAPTAQPADQRADALMAQMTQTEKLALVNGDGGPVTNIPALPRGAGGYIAGMPALGIPDLYFVDGSLGLADSSAPATALPSSLASAATWDTDLAYKFGSVIGAEVAAYGMNVNLGGNTNLIGREPRDGRTFETKGEDPILAGKIAAQHIMGVQDQHVIGCTKHYALNDQETGRTLADVQIDERGMRESDLLAFEIAVKDSGVQSVMCSYNQVNDTYSCENAHLLTDILKNGWGFPGFVMSDWWATHSTVAAALAGLDQEQPDNEYFATLGQAVTNGQVPQSRVDDMVHRILRAMYQAGLFDYPNTVGTIDSATDQAIAQEVEEQGAVLLKNAGGQLPLNAAALHSIAVIGWHADMGVLSGGGSAQVWPTGGAITEGYPATPGWSAVVWDPSPPLTAIQAMAPGVTVNFADGTNASAAASLAGASDVAIVFISQWTSEGMDMPSLNFTDLIHTGNPVSPIDQDALVAAVAAANPHTIVVMENGGAQVMPWLGNVSAVLEAWFPGLRGGQAIANILFGAVNPSGKLPITFPASVNDLPHPVIAGAGATAIFPVDYSEGFLVGYKWYDANNITPLFPFGFGLSYTTFSLANANIVSNLAASNLNPNFQVNVTVANTGSVAGADVAQVYLGLPASTGEPPKRLVGWQKVTLQPGATEQLTIEVDENDSSHPMAYWDVTSGSWLIAPGDYPVYVGDSAANLTLAGTIQVGS
jgi:beta-glucosidase